MIAPSTIRPHAAAKAQVGAARPRATSSTVETIGDAYESTPSSDTSPFFMPMSHSRKAAPTGPRPRPVKASQAVTPSGQIHCSNSRLQRSASAEVARHDTATLSLGTAANSRDATE